MSKDFDAIVVGAGHAGCEAARVLAQRKLSVALVTMNKNKIAAMSCNPAIGGVAKGHLVFEVDALGGFMGQMADLSSIQARRLNMRKGPSVRSTRVQCDKDYYSRKMGVRISSLEGLEVVESEVKELIYNRGLTKVEGVRLPDGSEVRAKAVIITAGTFMQALMFCGSEKSEGGRVGDPASLGLSGSIKKSGHTTKRLKTGTPARLEGLSINFARMQRQWGDPEQRYFSWTKTPARLPQTSCYITHTNERTHDIIRANMDRSPLFSGDIQGIGPRYCPSIEDKVKRFPERQQHQIFIEPEGLSTTSIYPNGLSTSLPREVQQEYLRTLVGLEEVRIRIPGYAVEYDSLDPTELTTGLMSKKVEALFFAGQVNRTSGYEEAAAQGLWAGLCASCYVLGQEAPFPLRSRSYIETLVDDLTSKGTQEPYRLFTSRSEYRLHLREDNACDRLFELGREYGLLTQEQIKHYERRQGHLELARAKLDGSRVRISKDRVISLGEYLKRPEICWEDISAQHVELSGMEEALEKLEIDYKYEGYLKKMQAEILQLEKVLTLKLKIPEKVIPLAGVSNEVCEKLFSIRPKSVFELSRISGVTPAAILSISRLLGRKKAVSHETNPE